jgi:exonuclease VII large subunit
MLQRFYGALESIDRSVRRKFDKLSSNLYFLATKIVNNAEKAREKQYFKIETILKKCENRCENLLKTAYSDVKTSTSIQQSAIEKRYLKYDKALALSVLKLENNSPLKILSQGYSVIEKTGKSVKSIKALNVGDNVNIYFSDGQAVAQIKEKKNEI